MTQGIKTSQQSYIKGLAQSPSNKGGSSTEGVLVTPGHGQVCWCPSLFQRNALSLVFPEAFSIVSFKGTAKAPGVSLAQTGVQGHCGRTFHLPLTVVQPCCSVMCCSARGPNTPKRLMAVSQNSFRQAQPPEVTEEQSSVALPLHSKAWQKLRKTYCRGMLAEK